MAAIAGGGGGLKRKKVLLMGKSNSGKTSMRSIIFASFLARDTSRLKATIDVQTHQVRFLGSLVLNLWDCGGQELFYENYFESQRDHIFRDVQVLIYVFDIESRDLEKDFANYEMCIEAIQENSADAQVFCLVHKMDLVPDEARDKVRGWVGVNRQCITSVDAPYHNPQVFKEREAMILARSGTIDVRCFKTSIWDETLYRAWSAIVHALVPNTKALAANLEEFRRILDADEVVLFERATFLVVSDATRKGKEHRDVHRHEKISNIIKQFKLSCSKSLAQFHSMTVRNSSFTAFIDQFTSTTYAMVIISDASIPEAATALNVRVGAKCFEEILQETSAGAGGKK